MVPVTPLAAKILIFGVPLALSLAWFLFWVIRLSRAARRAKAGSGSAPGASPLDKPPSDG